jgi:hypothetical protein
MNARLRQFVGYRAADSAGRSVGKNANLTKLKSSVLADMSAYSDSNRACPNEKGRYRVMGSTNIPSHSCSQWRGPDRSACIARPRRIGGCAKRVLAHPVLTTAARLTELSRPQVAG